MEKENSQSLLYRDLMVLYPYVASLLDYIDALHIDHDLGSLNCVKFDMQKEILPLRSREISNYYDL